MPPVSITRTVTTSGSGTGPNFAAMSRVVRETGLLRRSRWFYGILLGSLFAGLGGAVTGFVLLGDSWFQLLIAAALGLIFTQFAFFAHEAAHRQVLASGPANDRLGRIIGTAMAGMSYQWWMTKHTRHHANPNRVGKDPAAYARDFHDITPTDLGTGLPSTNGAYPSLPGWDYQTGWGVPRVAGLMCDLAGRCPAGT